MSEGQAAPAAALNTPVPGDVVSRIDAILNAEKPQQPQKQAKEPVQQAEPEAQEEQVEAQPNRQVEGEEPQEESQQEQTEQNEQTEQPREMAEIPLDQLEAIELEVKVKGEDGKDVVEKPTVKELREGYMRQRDYQRKTAEVARQREEVGTQVRQAVESERKQYQESLVQMQALLLETAAPELRNVDWNDLATNDPLTYVQRRNRADQIAQAQSAIQARLKEVTDKQIAEAEAAKKQAALKAVETLEKDIPGWNDNLYQELIASSKQFGFKPEEVANWIDPRAIKLLHTALKAQKAAPQKPSAEKKVVVAPKVVKPGAAAAQTQAQQRHAEAVKRLQKNGTVEDAAAVIAARIRM